MFQLGDQVIYGIHGVCDIVQIEEKVIDRKTQLLCAAAILRQ